MDWNVCTPNHLKCGLNKKTLFKKYLVLFFWCWSYQNRWHFTLIYDYTKCRLQTKQAVKQSSSPFQNVYESITVPLQYPYWTQQNRNQLIKLAPSFNMIMADRWWPHLLICASSSIPLLHVKYMPPPPDCCLPIKPSSLTLTYCSCSKPSPPPLYTNYFPPHSV